jgi:hypothetical protein
VSVQLHAVCQAAVLSQAIDLTSYLCRVAWLAASPGCPGPGQRTGERTLGRTRPPRAQSAEASTAGSVRGHRSGALRSRRLKRHGHSAEPYLGHRVVTALKSRGHDADTLARDHFVSGVARSRGNIACACLAIAQASARLSFWLARAFACTQAHTNIHPGGPDGQSPSHRTPEGNPEGH